MSTRISKYVSEIAQKIFHGMLDSNEFPEVQWHQEGNFQTYMMVEYMNRWSTFAGILNSRMKERLGEGLWTRKRSADFLASVEKIASEITAEEVRNAPTRLRTLID